MRFGCKAGAEGLCVMEARPEMLCAVGKGVCET